MDKSEFENVNCPHPHTCRLSNMCIVATLIRKSRGENIQNLVSSGCVHPDKIEATNVIRDKNKTN